MPSSLKLNYEAKGVTVDIWPLRDENDVAEVFRAVRTIYQIAQHKCGLKKEEIIADYTGGTKSMTAGLVLAAIADGVDLQYMKPNAYTPGGLADKGTGSQPRLVTVNFVDVAEQTMLESGS